jgi:hypothetical protein
VEDVVGESKTFQLSSSLLGCKHSRQSVLLLCQATILGVRGWMEEQVEEGEMRAWELEALVTSGQILWPRM